MTSPGCRRLLLTFCLPLLVGPGTAQTILMAAWQYGMAGQDGFYRDLAREFGKAHPGRRVRIELRPWTEAHGLLGRWAREGGAPDLAMMPDVWLAEFRPLLERYTAGLPREFLERFEPAMLERSRDGGAPLGLVWAASTKALFYRTDLFAAAGLKPPATWDEMLTAAKALNRPPGVCGLSMPGARALDTADNFYFLLWSNGGALYGRDGRAALHTPEALEALRFYRDLALRHKVTEPNLAGCDKQCAEDLFARGGAAMVAAGPWAIRAFGSAAVPFGVAPLPEKREQITQLVTDHLVMFRSSAAKTVALDFIRFAYGREWRLRWARMGMLPELREVAADPFFQNDPHWRVFLSVLPRSRWIPIRRWEPKDRAIRDALAEVAAGRLEPEQALKHLNAELNR